MDESNTANLVNDLREKVLSAVESMAPGEYHPDDVERFKQNDKWVYRFLEHHECDLNRAQNMAIESLKWRKKYGVHDLSEETLPKSLLKMGAIYEYTHDKEGHKILMLHIKMHLKDPDISNKKKLLVYWIEKMEQSYDGEKITVFFDMTDSGISNMDLDLVKFLISLFKYYYPYFLAYILVYEMPWIMNAAWKVVKTWLSAKAIDKIKFINKNTVQEFVDADQLPDYMGGTNTFKYVYKSDNGSDSTSSDSEQFSSSSTPRKKVHFAMDPVKQDDLSGGGDVKNNYLQENSRHNLRNFMTYYNGRFLRISPAEELVFSMDSQGDNTGSLNLINDTEKSVAFKVKTTTPEKFRVRPSSGIVKPMSHADILVQLQPGYQNSSLVRDKFLVMAMQIEGNDVTNQEVIELWRNCPRENIMEHKLRCSLIIPSISKESLEIHQSGTCKNDICQHAMLEIKSLQSTIIKMRHEIYALFIVLVLVMLITLILIVIIWRNFDLTPSNDYAANSCVNIHPT